MLLIGLVRIVACFCLNEFRFHFPTIFVCFQLLLSMAAKEVVSASSFESKITEEDHDLWMRAMTRTRSNINILQDRFITVDDDSQNEIETLLRRVKTATAFLTYLKSKASTVAAADLANLSLGAHQLQGSMDEHDGTYVTEMLKHVETVTGVMESLARRAIIAESQAAIEKRKVILSEEEIQRKVGQIDNMSIKLEDMEKFSLRTSSILCEMRQRVDDLVEEASRQKLRATENEQELSRVRGDFESLKSYVTSLISVRETLVSSEKQFQTIERLFERLAYLLLLPWFSSICLPIDSVGSRIINCGHHSINLPTHYVGSRTCLWLLITIYRADLSSFPSLSCY